MYSIKYLLENSNLPGPRGNLELLYAFSKNADLKIADKCLSFIKEETKNSPEEFVGMCGILSFSILNDKKNKYVMGFLRKYASHGSWRIRESVAMSIQEISFHDMKASLQNLEPMIKGNYYEQRAVVAGLCEPKLLKDKDINDQILKIMEKITNNMDHDKKLSPAEDSLRKALGYGWSVIIAASPKNGKLHFEKLFSLTGKHISWIIRENLKKNRLIKMDKKWVDKNNRLFSAVL